MGEISEQSVDIALFIWVSMYFARKCKLGALANPAAVFFHYYLVLFSVSVFVSFPSLHLRQLNWPHTHPFKEFIL